jgi:flagellar biosynthetic protein FliR
MNADALLREMGLMGSFQAFILVVGLIMARMIPLLTMNPFLGGQLMPQNVKTGIAILIAALVYKPLTAGFAHPIPTETLPYMALLLKETLFGACLGFLSALVFLAVQTGGRILDLARGANMANILAPQTGEQVSLMGELQFQMSIVLFFMLDGHHFFLRALYKSFELVPLEDFPNFVHNVRPPALYLAWASGQLFVIALLLAAPVVVATFLTDLVFGIMNRVSPQINVFFLAQPVKMIVGLVVVLFAIGFLTDQMQVHFAAMLRSVDYWIRLY